MDSSDSILGRLSLSSGLIGDGSGGTLDTEVSNEFIEECSAGSAAGDSSTGSAVGGVVGISWVTVRMMQPSGFFFLAGFPAPLSCLPLFLPVYKMCRVYRF